HNLQQKDEIIKQCQQKIEQYEQNIKQLTEQAAQAEPLCTASASAAERRESTHESGTVPMQQRQPAQPTPKINAPKQLPEEVVVWMRRATEEVDCLAPPTLDYPLPYPNQRRGSSPINPFKNKSTSVSGQTAAPSSKYQNASNAFMRQHHTPQFPSQSSTFNPFKNQ
ncbi:hypothetical protein, partial [Aneurinibacillus danicus]|uniref:hypothetical protein n=1 Tax=Aneurinibacillus danicus TaxID=267746 RepID=UPI0014784C9C